MTRPEKRQITNPESEIWVLVCDGCGWESSTHFISREYAEEAKSILHRGCRA
jgi:hypothetical protein